MARRIHLGVFSFVLTALWGAAFFGAFASGRLGQHPSPTAALWVMACFCAAASGMLLTLASFPGLAELLRPVGQLAAVGATLETAAILWTTVPARDRVLNLFQELGFSNVLLLPSMVALLASGLLIFTRWLSSAASRRRFQPQGAVQSMFLLFRRHHRLLGWLGLALAGAHSVYFLFIPGPTVEQWSGYAATALLAALGLEGLITDYNTPVRLWTHRVLAIAFLVAMVVHWRPVLPTATALAVALGVAAFLHLKLIAALTRLIDAGGGGGGSGGTSAKMAVPSTR